MERPCGWCRTGLPPALPRWRGRRRRRGRGLLLELLLQLLDLALRALQLGAQAAQGLLLRRALAAQRVELALDLRHARVLVADLLLEAGAIAGQRRALLLGLRAQLVALGGEGGQAGRERLALRRERGRAGDGLVARGGGRGARGLQRGRGAEQLPA